MSSNGRKECAPSALGEIGGVRLSNGRKECALSLATMPIKKERILTLETREAGRLALDKVLE